MIGYLIKWEGLFEPQIYGVALDFETARRKVFELWEKMCKNDPEQCNYQEGVTEFLLTDRIKHFIWLEGVNIFY